MIKTLEEYRETLLALPSEITREFEKKVVSLATEIQEDDFTNWVSQYMNMPAGCSDEDEKLAFTSYCITVNHARRYRNATKEDQLIADYAQRFSSHPFYGHMKLLSMLDNLDDFDVEDILELAYRNSVNLPDNGGVHHALAETVAILFEAAEFNPKRKPEDSWLEKGESACRFALMQDPNYAKFYCTKARLQSLKGDYEEAIKNITIAIDVEDSSRADYALRIGRYQMHDMVIRGRQRNAKMEQAMRDRMTTELDQQMNQYLEGVRQKQEELETQASQSMSKNMEFLGLFAGIVSFTISGVSITGNFAGSSFRGAAGLIIILMGALLSVYGGFGIILHGYKGEKSRRNVVVIALGILIVLGGLILCCFA